MSVYNNVSRYVIPFYFDYEDNGYTKVCNTLLQSEASVAESQYLPQDGKWVKKGFWESTKAENDNQPELDIYTYLLETLHVKEGSTNESNLGESFMFMRQKNGDGTLIKDLQYIHSENNVINFSIGDLGVVLFRNGIGFIWYDIKLKKKEISIDEYIDFQHDIKELARTHSEKFLRKIVSHGEGKNVKVQYEPFCFGKWISEIFIVETKLEIRFWAERKTTVSDKDIIIPDKALLFQYLFVPEKEQQERKDLAYLTANGYDRKYNVPTILDDEIYEPFGNACFCASKSGVSYVISDNNTNTEFFKNNFDKKYIRDYFFIYILLLYQSYSSSHYSRLLTKFPADVQMIETDSKYLDQLESLARQINLFLVKSFYESVSNVQHQNGVYLCVKKALRIEENMKSITVGLEALRGIEVERQRKDDEEKESKRERAINTGLTLFGFLVVISTMIDALNLVDWFKGNSMGVWHIASVSIILFVTVVVLIVLLVNSIKKK